MSGGLGRMESVRKLKELKQESSNVVNFSQRLGKCCGLTGSIGIVLLTIVFVLLVIGLGFAKLIIGGIYFHNCPLQPLIPIWLIVGATINFLYNGVFNRKEKEGVCRSVFAIFVSFFTFVWLILGTVWIIQTNQGIKSCDALTGTTNEEMVFPGGRNQTNTTSSTALPTDICERCDMRLFNFAFVVLIIEWSFVVIVVVLASFCCCCYLIMNLCVDREG